MKAAIALLLLAMVVCVSCQVYNYGYDTYTPGARVSHHASSGVGYHPYAPHYAYNYAYGAYPYRVY